MKKETIMKKYIRYLIVFLLINFGLSLEQSHASQDQIIPFEFQSKLVEYSSELGTVKIEVKITQRFSHEAMTSCEKLGVTLTPVDGLECVGELNWDIAIDEKTPFIKVIDVQVPVNDTSGLYFKMKCVKFELAYPLYLMAVNDTILFTGSNPLYQRHLPRYGTPEEEAERRRKISEEADKRYAEEEKKLLAHQPKVTTQPIAPFTRDDSLFYDSLTDNGKRTFRKMKYLELQGPSTERHGETALIDNYGFNRDSGQTYFYRVKGVTKDEMRADSRRRRDSLLAISPPNVYDIIIDLRNQTDYLFVKDKVDLIEKTERDGFYRVECNKAVITEIEQRKIKFTRTHKPAWIKSDSAKAERRKQKEVPKKIGKINESSTNMSSLFLKVLRAFSLEIGM